MDKSIARYKRPLVALALAALLLVGLSSVGPAASPAALRSPTLISTSTNPALAPRPEVDHAQVGHEGGKLPSSSRPSPLTRPPVNVDRSNLRCALQVRRLSSEAAKGFASFGLTNRLSFVFHQDSQFFHEEVWGAALYSLAQWGCDLSLFRACASG